VTCRPTAARCGPGWPGAPPSQYGIRDRAKRNTRSPARFVWALERMRDYTFSLSLSTPQLNNFLTCRYMEHVCRITRPYTDLVRIFSNWTEVSDQVLVYEHPAGVSRRTGKAQKIHCHVLIQGCLIGEEALKKRIKNMIQLSGNADWSWTKKEYSDPKKYITYMTKGIYQPKYNKGYDPEELEACRDHWVEKILPAISPESSPILKDSKETIISQWAEYVVHFEKWWKGKAHNMHIDLFKIEARKFWYNQNDHHLGPPGSQQKRFLTWIFYHYKVIGSASRGREYAEKDDDFQVFESLT